MEIEAGILSENSELVDDIQNSCQSCQFRRFKTIDSLRYEGYSLLIIDGDIFEDQTSIQFYLSRIRKKIQDTPVILVLRVNNVIQVDRDWFFDDFILFPFRKNELSARINLLLWGAESSEDLLTAGNLKINLKEYSVYYNNQKLNLTYKEFELLRLFFQNRGTVFSRKELLNRIWGVEYIGGTRTVDVHIRRLRSKLGEKFDTMIETVRNVGYRCRE